MTTSPSFTASRCASITRTPISPAAFTMRPISASWSAAAPNGCARSATSTAFWPANKASSLRFVASKSTIFAPAAIDDLLEIETRVAAVRGAAIDFAQAVSRGGQTLATAKILVASLRGGRPMRVPLRIARAIRSGNLRLCLTYAVDCAVESRRQRFEPFGDALVEAAKVGAARQCADGLPQTEIVVVELVETLRRGVAPPPRSPGGSRRRRGGRASNWRRSSRVATSGARRRRRRWRRASPAR